MLIYIDESGSINNHNATHCPYFVIALIHVSDSAKTKKAYKRFVAKHLDRLRELDVDKVDNRGTIIRPGGKMFKNGDFCELKGSQFDHAMKREFLHFLQKRNILRCYSLK